VDDRKLLNGILFVLRTGCQWDALAGTGICAKSTAHDRYQEWKRAGVFEKLWEAALKEYDALQGIDWEWLAMDGAMTKAPLGGEKNRPQSH
jgi:transposase